MALLREYAANCSETAFEELVSRRVGFVYSAALRQVRDPFIAGEITQAVFIILAQKAGRISEKAILTGWLFRTTRFAALAHMRADTKRRQRELEVQMQSEFQSPAADAIWNQMSPLLDEALATLGEKDRQAVLLRFFENKSLAEVGKNLGTGEDTARKRVSRALEKLHRYFSKRGVNSTTAIIAGEISANSVQAAPVALAKSVTAAAIAKGAAASTSTLTLIKGALKIMAWTKAKTAIVGGVVVLLAAGTTTVVHEIRWYQTYSWRIKGLDEKDIAKLPKWPPQVWIKPAKNTNLPNRNQLGLGIDGMLMGRDVPLSWLIRDAYGKTQPWMIFKDGLTDDRSYDFMANLPQGSHEALQREINKSIGISVRHQVIETNVLVLKIGKGVVHGLQAPDFTHKADLLAGNGTITWFAKPLSTLDVILEMYGGIPIVDKTGLTNIYKYSIPWDDNWRFGSPHILDELKPILSERFGLELIPTNMPIEMLVVEKVKW